MRKLNIRNIEKKKHAGDWLIVKVNNYKLCGFFA